MRVCYRRVVNCVIIYLCDISVPSFEATKYLITNGEFVEFVDAGGYSRRDVWSVEGWQWVQQRQARHPSFWICSHGFYLTRVSSTFLFVNRYCRCRLGNKNASA